MSGHAADAQAIADGMATWPRLQRGGPYLRELAPRCPPVLTQVSQPTMLGGHPDYDLPEKPALLDGHSASFDELQ